MNNYGYLQGLIFFVISGTNMSSNFIKMFMYGFLAQWAFHRVQKHPKQSSDEGVMTFRSWRSYVVKPSRADLSWPSLPDLAELGLTPTDKTRPKNPPKILWVVPPNEVPTVQSLGYVQWNPNFKKESKHLH